MPKNKGKVCNLSSQEFTATNIIFKGGKNRRRGKNENDNEKRELTFKEEGQGKTPVL